MVVSRRVEYHVALTEPIRDVVADSAVQPRGTRWTVVGFIAADWGDSARVVRWSVKAMRQRRAGEPRGGVVTIRTSDPRVLEALRDAELIIASGGRG